MNRTNRLLEACGLVIAFGACISVQAYQVEAFRPAVKAHASTAALWRTRGDIGALNTLYGSGDKEQQPIGKFTFIKEDKHGSAAKFELVDGRGVHWKAKLGEETQSETAATRLLWAAGYFTDEDYYLPEIRVAKMPKLKRGHEFVTADGVVRSVRLERIVTGQKKKGNWSWFKNPFVGTKEMNGLRIMMALINNWDLKEVNNAIYKRADGGLTYVVSDLGASFGKTGNIFTRSKSDPQDYNKSKFVQKVTSKDVDFFLSSRPFVLTAINVPNYVTRTHMQDIVKDIPLAHAKWLGKLLGQLSDEQIRDCFRAAGYSPEAVEGNASVVKERIRDLNSI